jgi:hypothetical protein
MHSVRGGELGQAQTLFGGQWLAVVQCLVGRDQGTPGAFHGELSCPVHEQQFGQIGVSGVQAGILEFGGQGSGQCRFSLSHRSPL